MVRRRKVTARAKAKAKRVEKRRAAKKVARKRRKKKRRRSQRTSNPHLKTVSSSVVQLCSTFSVFKSGDERSNTQLLQPFWHSLTVISIECLKSAQCAPLKHHYDECAERVQQQQEEHGHPKEDCVEECKSNPYTLGPWEAAKQFC